MGTINYLQSILKDYKGSASRIQTIFDYHYDQILREVEVETAKLPNHNDIMDGFTELMEDIWPVAQGDFTTEMED